MTTDTGKKNKPKEKKLTFKCAYCEKTKSFDDMVIVTRYFPAIVICRDCEKNLR